MRTITDELIEKNPQWEKYRDTVEDAIKFLLKHEKSWNLKYKIDKEEYIRNLLENIIDED